MATVNGGPINAVVVVQDADLQENGGDYVVQGRVARRAYLFSTEQRAVKAGPALPVYLVTQAQLDSGAFRLFGSDVMEPIMTVTGRPVRGSVAIPVFVEAQE